MKLHQKLFWLLVFLLPLQLGRHFWPPWSYVLGLKVDYLSPTIYLTDILVFLILSLWVFDLILHSKFSISLYKFGKIVELTLLGLYVAKNGYQLSAVSYPLSWAVFYSSLIAIAQFFKQASLNGFFWWLGERTFNVATPGIAKAIINGQLIMRPYGTFPHPNVLAGFLLIGLILTIPYFDPPIGGEKQGLPYLFQKNKFLFMSYLLIVVLAIALSFSRSVWLLGLISSLFFLWKSKIPKKLFWLAGGFWLIILILAFYLLPHFSTNEAFFQRWQLMKAAGLMIKNDLLAGIGLNNFIVRLPDYWPVTGFTYWLQPVHNFYLLLLAETGMIGFLIFIWLLILVFRRFLKPSSMINFPLFRVSERNKLHLLMALVAILLLGLTDHYWLTLQQGQILFALVLGLAWSSKI
ncbi:MAG: O-antigen ligase family protein [Candidatus Shapirobacteria bacterium]|nr:O-antigen ligase family protein [Candidatus Shapirobacteria bacterium]